MPDFLTIQEVAEMLRLPVSTLYHYRAAGKGGPKSAKFGKRVVYARADVESFIEQAYANASE